MSTEPLEIIPDNGLFRILKDARALERQERQRTADQLHTIRQRLEQST